jgi:hypothetical protein
MRYGKELDLGHWQEMKKRKKYDGGGEIDDI